MADHQMNANYTGLSRQLFNPLAGGQGIYGAGFGSQAPGLGSGINFGIQNQTQNQAQILAAVQLAQQIVTKVAMQAIQCAQALQTLVQVARSQAQQSPGLQGQFGYDAGAGLPLSQVGQAGQSARVLASPTPGAHRTPLIRPCNRSSRPCSAATRTAVHPTTGCTPVPQTETRLRIAQGDRNIAENHHG